MRVAERHSMAQHDILPNDGVVIDDDAEAVIETKTWADGGFWTHLDPQEALSHHSVKSSNPILDDTRHQGVEPGGPCNAKPDQDKPGLRITRIGVPVAPNGATEGLVARCCKDHWSRISPTCELGLPQFMYLCQSH